MRNPKRPQRYVQSLKEQFQDLVAIGGPKALEKANWDVKTTPKMVVATKYGFSFKKAIKTMLL